jgi:hypothetical protein
MRVMGIVNRSQLQFFPKLKQGWTLGDFIAEQHYLELKKMHFTEVGALSAMVSNRLFTYMA